MVSTLYWHEDVDPDFESTDASQCSWFSAEEMVEMNMHRTDQFHFNDEVAEFIASGLCSSLLSDALSGCPNLKTLMIHAPEVELGMKPDKLKDIRNRWSLACKVLLSSVFASKTAIEELVLASEWPSLAFPLSALDVTALPCSLSSSLKKLHLDLKVNPANGKLPSQLTVLTT